MEPAVHLDVEPDATADAQRAQAGLALEVRHQAQHGLLEQPLGLEREVLVDRLELARALPRRQADQLDQLIGEALGVGVRAVVDVLRVDLVVEAERSAAHDLLELRTQLEVLAAVGGEAHHLVLAVVRLEPEVLGDRGVEPAERVRDFDAVEWLEPRAVAAPHRRAVAVARTVDRQHERLIGWRQKECRRGVRAVVRIELERWDLARFDPERAHQVVGERPAQRGRREHPDVALLPALGRASGG